ncbi:MFS general substrate transporter [Fomitiporia mediterranea MF3/22]|uniref:MFS general substrate transporter n=1 Tax=Fomitiporia mediterranea (strain MF3/22) TaxID=694068 RepID=UPI000440916F|nr:MFS general substrate transporter [Fomitiporia mediterranea MF3/22]EJD04276.1 MFS general substrate transporter [Fomitiporia mediterranea MF3/22]
MFGLPSRQSKPRGLKWRSSVWFATLIVGYGITVDVMVYALVIPVLPFQLEKLGFHHVSALVAYLLLAFSVTLVIFSPLFSWLSEKYRTRRSPLIWGLISLMGFLVMFMEAPNYAVMIVARGLQGISSAVVWVVGLALLADCVPDAKVGQQLGWAMSGMPIGALVAPPVAGVLYDRFGFRAPFVFGIILTGGDLIGRLLLIERKDALKWSYDPAELASASLEEPVEGPPAPTPETGYHADKSEGEGSERTQKKEGNDIKDSSNNNPSLKLSEFQVWKFMLKSQRTMVAITTVLVYGIVFAGLEPTLALRLQHVYDFNATKVGLVDLASAAAAIFASPISGYLSDRFGTEWITILCILLTIPWYMLLVIKGHLAFFIVCLAVGMFALSGLVTPLMAELASVVRQVDGVGFAHVYGFFNLAYGLGSAVGPIIAGLVYSHSKKGWQILLAYGSGLLLLCSILNFFFGGERPLARRWFRGNNNAT